MASWGTWEWRLKQNYVRFTTHLTLLFTPTDIPFVKYIKKEIPQGNQQLILRGLILQDEQKLSDLGIYGSEILLFEHTLDSYDSPQDLQETTPQIKEQPVVLQQINNKRTNKKQRAKKKTKQNGDTKKNKKNNYRVFIFKVLKKGKDCSKIYVMSIIS